MTWAIRGRCGARFEGEGRMEEGEEAVWAVGVWVCGCVGIRDDGARERATRGMAKNGRRRSRCMPGRGSFR